MISERQLKTWREKVLCSPDMSGYKNMGVDGLVLYTKALQDQVLKLTQELLDQHLIRKEERYE
jgi:hypothetical protein